MVPFVYIIVFIWMGTFLILVALNFCFKKKYVVDPESPATLADHPHEE